jgi:hypothetical protein
MRPSSIGQVTAMIRFRCKHCGHRIKTPDETAGRKGKCPECHLPVRVPISNASPTPRLPNQQQSQPLQACCSRCDKPLREVRRHGKATGRRICPTCVGEPGFCPLCDSRLPSPQAQQCPSCHAQWDRVVPEAEEIEANRRRERFNRMGKMALYYVKSHNVGWHIAVSLLAGLIGVAGGLALLHEDPLNAIAIGIGGLLLLNGLFLLITRNPVALLFDGIAMCAFGVYIFLLVCAQMAGVGRVGFAWMLMAPGLFWEGRAAIAGYRRYAEGAAVGDPVLAAEVKQAVDGLCRTYLTLPKDLIAFNGDNLQWRCRLTPSYGVFATGQGEQVLFVAPEDVAVRELGKARWSKKLKVEITLLDRVIQGKMGPQFLERVEQWKTANAHPGRTPRHIQPVPTPDAAPGQVA